MDPDAPEEDDEENEVDDADGDQEDRASLNYANLDYL